MPKVLVIAKREFGAMVATKAFLLTLVMMPVLMLGGLVLLPSLGKLGGRKERTIAVADATGSLLPMIREAAEKRNDAMSDQDQSESEGSSGEDPFSGEELWHFEPTDEPTLTESDRLALSDQTREGELYAFVEIPVELTELASPAPAKLVFVSQDAALSGARRWLEQIVREEMRSRRLDELGIDIALVDRANTPIWVEPTNPFKRGQKEGESAGGIAGVLTTMFLPFGIMMLMFLVIFLAAQPMLESAMEEKSARIAELLLGSVSPQTLMMGKLLGNVAGSFVVFAIYVTGAMIAVQQNDWSIDLPWSIMPWLILFQVLGVLFYSSIFLTIGASVSELKEAQSLLLPVWLMLMIPMMVWFVAVRDPNGVVAVSLSFLPPTTPLMMSLRMSAGQAMPAWHAPVAAVLMLVTTWGVVVMAGRIYRAGLLKNDSAKSLFQLYRRLRAAE